MFSPVEVDLVELVVHFSEQRSASFAFVDDFAVGAHAHRATHREVVVGVGQDLRARIDRADAVDVLAKFTEVVIFTYIGTNDIEVFAILSDEEADDVGRNNDVAVGLAFTFSLSKVDDARLL